jgi:hypothetical protein
MESSVAHHHNTLSIRLQNINFSNSLCVCIFVGLGTLRLLVCSSGWFSLTPSSITACC